jgi:hypothetical protein
MYSGIPQEKSIKAGRAIFLLKKWGLKTDNYINERIMKI